MSRITQLVGGAWAERTIEVPEHEPKQILMPLVDTELKLLTYERQPDGQYKFQGENK